MLNALRSHEMPIFFFQVLSQARRYLAVSSLSMVYFFCDPTDQISRGLTRGHRPGCSIELITVQEALHASQPTRTWSIPGKPIHHVTRQIQYLQFSIDFTAVPCDLRGPSRLRTIILVKQKRAVAD
jgi:hypothetical protein